MHKIGVIGAGAWGTALSQALANTGRNVTIWAREPEVVEAINEEHENTTYLKGVKLNKDLKATDSLAEVCNAEVVAVMTPAQHVRATLETIKDKLSGGKPFVIGAKGIEKRNRLFDVRSR